jgi:hypothetical protein
LCKLFPQFSATSHYFGNYSGPLFKSAVLGNYELLPAAPGAGAGQQIPGEIKKLLRQSKGVGKYVGAYPQAP